MIARRREFMAAAGAAVTAAVLDAPRVLAQPKVQWRMSTAWTSSLDTLQGSALRLAKVVDEMSGGRFKIEVFPGGQIMPPLECFDATSKGTIEAYMAASHYWQAKEPAVQWFSAVPFGMNSEGMIAWFYQGDGLKLWSETYADFNLVPRPGPSVAPQMAGWFRRKIVGIADFKGLKMRIPGLGGKVINRAGGATVLTPASEIYGALERGTIDAAEWIAPHEDLKLGLQNTARYYYYPGWHEPGSMPEFCFYRKAHEALPAELRAILDHAVAAVQVYGLTDYHAKNAVAVGRVKTEFKGKVEMLPLPVPVLRDLKKLAADVVREESERSAIARKVHASFSKFQALVGPWDHVAEGAYHQLVAG